MRFDLIGSVVAVIDVMDHEAVDGREPQALQGFAVLLSDAVV